MVASPLLKNMGLAFLAGFVTTMELFLVTHPDVPGPDALVAAGLAAVYAGGRGVVGYLKEKYGKAPFAVDTEAEPEV